MENVLSVESITDDIFQCGRCKLAFTSLTMFLEHKREPCAPPIWPAQSPVLECINANAKLMHASRPPPNPAHAPPLYDITIPHDDRRANHESAAEEPLRLSCNHCQKTFKRANALSLHLKIHSRERDFQCPVCGRCFVQNTQLKRHMASHRVWPDGLSRTVPAAPHSLSPSSAYVCAYCNQLLPNYTKFRIHLKSHISEKLFMCIQSGCSGLFPDLDLLLLHVKESHPCPTYNCHLCTFSHNSLEDLAKHQKNHPNSGENPKDEKKYHCSRCDSTFKSLEKLTFHAATHDHVCPCPLCDMNFASEKRLRTHLRTHEDTRPFRCHVCGASFRLKKYLETHFLRHGERKHVCPVCGLKFKRIDLLRRHAKKHTVRKKWECPFKAQFGCRLQFSRTDKMKLHLKSHAKRMGNTISSNSGRETSATSTIEIVIIPVNEILDQDCGSEEKKL